MDDVVYREFKIGEARNEGSIDLYRRACSKTMLDESIRRLMYFTRIANMDPMRQAEDP